MAASPRDEIADTHWYRADFDHLLVKEAQKLGVDYLDRVALHAFTDVGSGELLWKAGATGRRLTLRQDSSSMPPVREAFCTRAAPGGTRFARISRHAGAVQPFHWSATSGRIHRFIERTTPRPTRSTMQRSITFSMADGSGFSDSTTASPAPVLRRRSSRLTTEVYRRRTRCWQRLLDQIPALREQFATAQAERSFIHIPRLSFRSAAIAGPRWALLPSAAGFVDPLLSTGFPLTLLGVERLAAILEQEWATATFDDRLQTYAAQTDRELLATARLVAALYATMNNFPVFVALSLLYFAAASYSEAARRLGKPHLASSFLLCEHPVFGMAVLDCSSGHDEP